MYEFVKALAKLSCVNEVWLFGSRARGDFQPRSDIDIAVITSQITDIEWEHILDIIDNADNLLKIDCIHFNKLNESDKLRQNILKHHVVLYAKNGGYMHKVLWKDYFETLGDALNRLEEVITHQDIDKVDYLQDASIQRFEFSIELYWKVLRKFLSYEHIEALTPREVLKNSYQYGLIDDEQIWISMLNDRNKTSHVYKKEDAHRIFEHIKTYFPIMKTTYEKLKHRFENM